MRYQFMRYPEGKAKALTFSYDDGCMEDLRLADILAKHGMKGTFNLNGEIMRGRNVSREEAENHFFANGHEVAVHGLLHRANGTLRPIEGIRDVLDCRLDLEKRYGRIIRGMAYPDSGIKHFDNGAEYAQTKQYLKDLGIAYSRTLGGDNNSFRLPDDWYAWMPTAHHNNPHLMEYLEEFINTDTSPKVYLPNRWPRLFYLWGHTFEFENNNNWEIIEKFCDRAAEKSDEIWFATNIEIYDYVKAYESLVYSADGTIIYNPTLLTIWFDIDGKPYVIKSGETLKI